MKRSYLILKLMLVFTLFAVAACGGSAELIVEKAAGDINFSAGDLGPGWSLQSDQGLEALQGFDQAHVTDANMRMFAADEGIGLVVAVVLTTNSVSSAEKEMKGDAVQNMGKDLEAQLAGVALESSQPSGLGDEAVMVAGTHEELGVNVYMVTFREANVIALFSLIGPTDKVDEALAMEHARKLEARMQ